jgi:hypothetical protein
VVAGIVKNTSRAVAAVVVVVAVIAAEGTEIGSAADTFDIDLVRRQERTEGIVHHRGHCKK